MVERIVIVVGFTVTGLFMAGWIGAIGLGVWSLVLLRAHSRDARGARF